jgi:hypothetical protein
VASLIVRQGRTRRWTATLLNYAETAITSTYSGSETLTLVLWPVGTSTASTLTTSGVAWLVAASGTVTITLTEADTTTLSAGTYEVNVTLASGGETYDAYSALVVIEAAKSQSGWLVDPLEVAASWSAFASLDYAEQAAIIEAASQSIEAYCRRAFAVTSYTETIDGTNKPRLWLTNRPVVSITSVTLDGSTLSASDYHVETGTGCLWRGAREYGYPDHRMSWPIGVGNVVVVYSAGYSTIPAPVKRAAVVQCKYLSDTSRASSVYSYESIGDYSYKTATIGESSGQALAPSVANLLATYVISEFA